jgi:hypothetical protein
MKIETFFGLISKKIHIGDNFACPGGARTGYGYRTVKLSLRINLYILMQEQTEKV